MSTERRFALIGHRHEEIDYDVQLREGKTFRVYDSANEDYLQLDVGSNDATFTGSGLVDVNFSGISGITFGLGDYIKWNTATFRVDQETLADDATGTFTVGNYALVVVTSSFNSTAMSVAFFTTTQSPVDIGSGSAVSLGTGSNPDVDGNVNIWKSGTGELSIKNRLGSSRTFAVYSFSPVASGH